MTREDGIAAIKKYGSHRAASAALGIHHATLTRILAGNPCKRGRPPKNATTVKPGAGVGIRSVREFRGLYDLETIVPQRVDAALKMLGSGWLYEIEFCKLANVSSTQLANFRDRYAAHILAPRDGRRVWVGRKAVAEEMRGML